MHLLSKKNENIKFNYLFQVFSYPFLLIRASTGIDNEDLMAQLNKDQFYDASGEEDDDVIEVNVQELTTQDAVLQVPL